MIPVSETAPISETDPMETFQGEVIRYLESPRGRSILLIRDHRFTVSALARGEYNLNYLLTRDDGLKLVFRVNMGTQIGRKDQILYEYRALELLKRSGVTPIPYHVDDSRKQIDRGILIMEFLPGVPLDYQRDLRQAARLFARIHQLKISPERNHLIREDAPFSLIFRECESLLNRYIESDLANPGIRSYLTELREWARQARRRERFFQEDPWPCIVNTEVNSGNFIANRDAGTLHLVDWEMPRWGDPSQDLSHFCSPLTTLWKTQYRMSEEAKHTFLGYYKSAVLDTHLLNTLEERVWLRDPFVFLRGISWSAMGWIAYQTDYKGVRNPDTWEKLKTYMNLEFIRGLFDPILAQTP
jgi:aminoglycoside phosphotransferase (APT) family kinase protein